MCVETALGDCHLSFKQDFAGSIPVTHTNFTVRIVNLVDGLPWTKKVVGSNPTVLTIFYSQVPVV